MLHMNDIDRSSIDGKNMTVFLPPIVRSTFTGATDNLCITQIVEEVETILSEGKDRVQTTFFDLLKTKEI